MSYLLHCIVEQALAAPGLGELSWDAQAQAIFVVAGYGLAAVVTWGELNAAPSVEALLAYERVVESIHARQTALPLRYGCWMESEEQIQRLLEERGAEFAAQLTRLRGMTEMGIRLLWPARAAVVPTAAASPVEAYFAFLRWRYSDGGTLAGEEDEQAGRIAALLADRCAGQRREVSTSSRGRMVSLAFLTPRSCVTEFRQIVRVITPLDGTKLLLSGPWPPYSFVTSSS